MAYAGEGVRLGGVGEVPPCPSVFLRSCMWQFSFPRGLMFLNWLEAVFSGHEIWWILEGIWETGSKTRGEIGVECPLPLLYQCTPFEAYSSCVEVFTLLAGEFHPHLDETYLGVPAASRDLLKACQTRPMGHWQGFGCWENSGKCIFWHSCFMFPDTAVPVTAYDEIMQPVNYLQRQG